MDQHLSLESAAVATGQPVHRLGNWCATGKLACERQDERWIIPLTQLLRVADLVAAREQAIVEGRPIAAVVPVTSVTPDLPGEIARRLGLPSQAVTTSFLALDGSEYLLALWRADGSKRQLEPVIQLVENLGGELLDGEIAT